MAQQRPLISSQVRLSDYSSPCLLEVLSRGRCWEARSWTGQSKAGGRMPLIGNRQLQRTRGLEGRAYGLCPRCKEVSVPLAIQTLTLLPNQ